MHLYFHLIQSLCLSHAALLEVFGCHARFFSEPSLPLLVIDTRALILTFIEFFAEIWSNYQYSDLRTLAMMESQLMSLDCGQNSDTQ